LIAVGR